MVAAAATGVPFLSDRGQPVGGGGVGGAAGAPVGARGARSVEETPRALPTGMV